MTPPGSGALSYIVTDSPANARAREHANPAGPAPITATRLPVGAAAAACRIPRAIS